MRSQQGMSNPHGYLPHSPDSFISSSSIPLQVLEPIPSHSMPSSSSHTHSLRSQSRASKHFTAAASQPDNSQQEVPVQPDGPHEFVHQRLHTHTTLLDEGESDEEEIKERRNLPWWKRPSPWWLLCALPFTAMAMTATIAPRIEVYTVLVCRAVRPDIYYDPDTSQLSSVPTRSQLCAADPVVQAVVAKLAAAMTTSMGILSCITAGWWGAFSDRYGRGYVMGIAAMGVLLTDFNFILVSCFPDKLPGGYWFLVLGPIAEGCLGGITSAGAAVYAYQADTTDDHNRSRIFSLALGLLFTGTALGPTLGALIIRFSGQLLSVFYASTAVHIVYTILVWFVLPQSLSMAYRRRARAKYAQELRANITQRDGRLSVKLSVFVKRFFAFLTPLAVFAPTIQEANNNPLKRKRDWNLMFLAVAHALSTTVQGSYSYKFQYASSRFGWTSEELGYWLSLVGAARAFFLTAILPPAIKFFKPKPGAAKRAGRSPETSPLLSPSDESSSFIGDSSKKSKETQSPVFDFGLARASLCFDMVSYAFMGLSPTPIAFTVFGMLGAVGTAYPPAIQAVALALYTQRGGTESGKLFGALSVLQALGSQILGPPLYGFIYMETVATSPWVIFFVSVLTIAAASLLLQCIRLPKPSRSHVTVEEDLGGPSGSIEGSG